MLALDSDWEAALEAPVNLSHGTDHADPSVLLNPESQDVAAALALFGAKVLSAVAFKSGTLCLVFDTGHHLTCSSDPSFEAWQVTGPTGWRFASLPGGDLAFWSSERVLASTRDSAGNETQRTESTRLTQSSPRRSAARGRLTSMRQDTWPADRLRGGAGRAGRGTSSELAMSCAVFFGLSVSLLWPGARTRGGSYD